MFDESMFGRVVLIDKNVYRDHEYSGHIHEQMVLRGLLRKDNDESDIDLFAVCEDENGKLHVYNTIYVYFVDLTETKNKLYDYELFNIPEEYVNMFFNCNPNATVYNKSGEEIQVVNISRDLSLEKPEYEITIYGKKKDEIYRYDVSDIYLYGWQIKALEGKYANKF